MSARSQSGVALLTAILVVALASLAAVAMVSGIELAIQRTSRLQDSERARWIAEGIESWVLSILEKDRRDNTLDGLDEDWARPVDLLPVDYGNARGGVSDLQGRFNLNNLALAVPSQPGATPGAPPVNDRYLKQFERLLSALPLDRAEIQPGLAGRIRDWMDADSEPTPPFGAEDAYYLGLKPPYRTANRRIAHISELRAIQGVTPKLYAALRTQVCAINETTTVNVNTASEAVLRSLSPTVDDAKLAAFLKSRVKKPVDNAAQLKTDGVFGDGYDASLAGVASRHFALAAEIFIGSSRVSLYSDILRPDQGAPVVLSHGSFAD